MLKWPDISFKFKCQNVGRVPGAFATCDLQSHDFKRICGVSRHIICGVRRRSYNESSALFINILTSFLCLWRLHLT